MGTSDSVPLSNTSETKDRPHLTPAWFASWLRSHFSVAQLREATGDRHPTLASKFRTGNAFPRAAYLEELARRSGHVELVLAAIAFLDECAPLRRAVRESLAGIPGDSIVPEVPPRTSSILEAQLQRRLRMAGGKRDIVHSTGPVVLLVANGHGVTSLARHLDSRVPPTRFVLDLSVSDIAEEQIADRISAFRGNREVTIVTPAQRAQFVQKIVGDVFNVPSPSWDDLFETVFGQPTSVDLSALDAVLIGPLPLALVHNALVGYYKSITEPISIAVERTDAPIGAQDPTSARPLSVVQRRLIRPAIELQRQVWGVVVEDRTALAASVAAHIAEVVNGRLIFGPSPRLSTVLRAWAQLLDQPEKWPDSLGSAPQASCGPFVVDLDIAPREVSSATDVLIGRVLSGLSHLIPGARWFLCGTEAQVRRAGGYFVDSLPAVVVCDWPLSEDRPSVAQPVARVGRRELLPDVAYWSSDGPPAEWYYDHWGLEGRLALLKINALIEVPVGQGGSAAARALMEIRIDTDERNQALLAVSDYVRNDSAEQILADAGFFATVPQGTFAPDLVGSPYLETVPHADDSERLRMAETVSSQIFGEPYLTLAQVPDEVLYLDLSPTRYGRVPVSGSMWNHPERLTPSYLALAENLLKEASRRKGQTFVVAPQGFYDPKIMPPSDWQLVQCHSIAGTVLDEVRRRHGIATGHPAPKDLMSSIATAEVLRLIEFTKMGYTSNDA